jgi:hypothetical protein
MKTKIRIIEEVYPNFVPDLRRLEEILRESKAQIYTCLAAGDPNLPDRIQTQLLALGVSLVRFPSVSSVKDSVETLVGRLLVQTFPSLSEPVRQDLAMGDFRKFFAELERNSYTDMKIAFKVRGMLSKPPLPVLDREGFRHPLTGCVHVDNPLVAKLGMQVWEAICDLYPLLNPAKWYNESLLQVDHTVQVSEDGLKLTERWIYASTPAHFDAQGQVRDPLVGETGRVQVVYCQDTGPVRLFVVPGSNKPEVLQILQRLTRSEDISSGYTKFEKAYGEIPAVRELFHKYGIALPGAGLLMFTAGIWHYEAVQKEAPNSVQPVETKFYGSGYHEPSHVALCTASSRNFRVFCGLKAIPKIDLEKAVVHAFLREHDWSMESFTPDNKNSGFFVNEKRGQSGLYKCYSYPDIAVFYELTQVPLATMKHYLSTHCSPFRISMYGLTPEALTE